MSEDGGCLCIDYLIKFSHITVSNFFNDVKPSVVSTQFACGRNASCII